MISFVTGFTAAIAWVWYVLGVVVAICVGGVVVLCAAITLSVLFDKLSEKVTALWRAAGKSKHEKE